MRIALLLLCALMALPLVHAIGITPPSAHIDFTPNQQGSFDVLVMNSRPFSITAGVNITGDLARYFNATGPKIGARGSATSTITYSLPADIDPGLHRQFIYYTEDFFDPNAGSFAARTSVGLTVDVWKPYPGKYAKLTLEPRNVPKGQKTDVHVTIDSKGDQAVTGDVNLRILDASGALIDSYVVPGFSVGANTNRGRYVQVNSQDYKPGKYTVKGSYDYGAGVATDSKTLKIGERTIIIDNTSTAVYLDQPVNKFTVTVESMWNQPLDDVAATFALGAHTGKTPSVTLPAFGSQQLVGYWDTDKALAPGNGTVLVTATFRNGTPVSRTFPITIYNQTPHPQKEAPATITLGLTDVLFVALMVLLLLAFGGYLWHIHARS